MLPMPDDNACTQREQRRELRHLLRARRRALSQAEQQLAVQRLHRKLQTLRDWRKARHIGIYVASDGEVRAEQLLHFPAANSKQFHTPVIRRDGKLDFRPYRPLAPVARNRFGIAESRLGRSRQPQRLDIILVPLVGADENGRRLGMGGGYYDTTFAFKQQKPNSKPWLLGVAHQCQQVEKLETAEWDIPLHVVVTDKQILS